MDYVNKKIKEANELALKLGLDKCTELEQKIFKVALNQIAVSAIDDTRQKVSDLMSDEAHTYIN